MTTAASRTPRGTLTGGWRPILIALLLAAAACDLPPDTAPAFVGPAPPPREVLALPNRPGSIKFAAIGDAGRGNRAQYDVSRQMSAFREVFEFDFVVMLGDNVYDGGTPDDYRRKFELPYRELLDDGVEFYATIGNHDDPNQIHYPPFHMEGQRYYTFLADGSLLSRLSDTDVRFFMIDTAALDSVQLAWLSRELGRSTARWDVPVFHRPIYTAGRYSGAAHLLRTALEPVLVQHDVRVGLSGHEHFYHRTVPLRGITHFISGGAGSLRRGDLRPSRITARGFDTDYHFMLFEATNDEMHYQAIGRTGHSIDAGTIAREPGAVD